MVLSRHAHARRRPFKKLVKSASIWVSADFDRLTEGQLMPLPSIFQDHSFKRLVQGAAVGAVATMIIGFNWGGWSLESTAEKRADEASELAVVAALAPVCADKFQHAAN